MKRIKKNILNMGIIILGILLLTPSIFAGYIDQIFGRKSFPFEKGIVQYLTLDGHGRQGVTILYVDGKKTTYEKFINNKLCEIVIDDTEHIYIVAPEFKKAKKESKSILNDFYEGLYAKKTKEELDKEINASKNEYIIKQEAFLDKQCDVYLFITKYTTKKVWQWEDLVLKEEIIETDNKKMIYSMVATDIDLNTPIPQDKFQVSNNIQIISTEDWNNDEQLKWLGVPKETITELKVSPEYKALEELSDIDDQWMNLPKEKRTKEAQKKFEEEMKKNYKKLGIDIDDSIKRAQLRVNESSASITLQSIHRACKTYKDIKGYYPSDLKILTDPDPVSYISAEWIDSKKHGYNFIYAPTSKGYTIVANPAAIGVTGTKRYFLDESGIIRFTSDGSEPTQNSTVLK